MDIELPMNRLSQVRSDPSGRITISESAAVPAVCSSTSSTSSLQQYQQYQQSAAVPALLAFASSCLSFRTQQFVSHRTDFHEI